MRCGRGLCNSRESQAVSAGRRGRHCWRGRSRRRSRASAWWTSRRAAGITYRHNSGAFGEKYLPETLGPGCAFLDYDNDGWQDILIVNGMDWPGHKRRRSTMRLYRNNRNGTFTDVTHSGRARYRDVRHGRCGGRLQQRRLPRHFRLVRGAEPAVPQHRARDVSSTSRRRRDWAITRGFSTSAMWFDYDRDGLLDLFVCNYVKWSADSGRLLQSGRQAQVVLHAGGLSRRDVLAVSQPRGRHVRGRDGEERDCSTRRRSRSAWPCSITTTTAGPICSSPTTRSRTSSIAISATARFEDVALHGGRRVQRRRQGARGHGRRCWPIYDNSGTPSLVVTNFDNEMLGLYRKDEAGSYIDLAPGSDIGRLSRRQPGVRLLLLRRRSGRASWICWW